ncbi:ABC transporter permease [Microtetraspora malaysiensis]|uniref:ABC transporter permease n=1 Tax=Microtetraspora malaysiensis TaxID=161358 RepID=UPI001C3F2319|nr:ABC transporter permease [Microtetraspora malaysiensis]
MSSTTLRGARTRVRRRGKRTAGGQRLFTAIVIGAVGFLILMVIFGPIFAPDGVNRSNLLNAMQPPSAEHWLGTDEQGRDVLWRLIIGARPTLLSAALVVACYGTIGTLVATFATLGGRWADEFLMRLTDMTLSLPGMVVALGFATALGPSLRSAIIAMVLVGWPMTARLLRGIMREAMTQPYISGARVLGASRWRVTFRHVLPNSMDVLIVKWAADIGFTVLILAGLSFIGVGAQPPSSEWGAMVAEARSYVSTAWWVALAPGAAIAFSATAFGLLGEVLQVRLNPALKAR